MTGSDARDGASDDRIPTVLLYGFAAVEAAAWSRVLLQHHNVVAAWDDAQATLLLSRGAIDLVLCHYEGSAPARLDFLQRLRVSYPHVVRLLLGSLDGESLARAIERTAIYQFIPEPCHPVHMSLTVSRALENRELARRHRRLSRSLKFSDDVIERLDSRRIDSGGARYTLDKLVYASLPMAELAQQTKRAATTDLPILVQGESGTGKELLARAIHRISERRDFPLLVQNCGALTDEALHSELFGHKRGAFSGAISDRLGLFAAADGGTIFLDEIGEVSPVFQVSLLRALQSGEVRPRGSDRVMTGNVRVIAASNRPLRKLVDEGKFRADLYFRLRGFELSVPPLRERRDDIPILADHFVRGYGEKIGRRILGISPEVQSRLDAYAWPGNVRELQSEMRRMVAVAESGEYLGLSHLSAHIAAIDPAAEQDEVSELLPPGSTLKEQVESLESRIVKGVLERHRWNQSRAAQELGLSRPGLANKIKRYGLRAHGRRA
jgi:two-component system response regulator HupR/HoxA